MLDDKSELELPDTQLEFNEHSIDENGVDIITVDDNGELYYIPLDDILTIEKSTRNRYKHDDVKSYDDEIWDLLNRKNLPTIKDSKEKGTAVTKLFNQQSEVKEYFAYNKEDMNAYEYFSDINEHINNVDANKLSPKEKNKYYEFWHDASRPLESLSDYLVNKGNQFSIESHSEKHLRRKYQRKDRPLNQVNFSNVKPKGLKPELAEMEDEAFITREQLRNGFMKYSAELTMFELLSPLNDTEKEISLLKIYKYLHPEIIEALNLKTEAKLQTQLRHIREKLTDSESMSVMLSPETKECKKCGEIKSISLFGNNKHHSDGLQSWCFDCEAQRKKNKYKKLKDKTNISA